MSGSADSRILTPATRLRWDAAKLRERRTALALEAGELVAAGGERHRSIHDRIIRTADRLSIIAAELEQLADELDPEPTIYAFGVTRAADDPIP